MNRAFAMREGLKFPVLSDPDGRVVQTYGVARENLARRVTFVIDEHGKIRHIDWSVRVSKHGDDLLRRIATLRKKPS